MPKGIRFQTITGRNEFRAQRLARLGKLRASGKDRPPSFVKVMFNEIRNDNNNNISWQFEEEKKKLPEIEEPLTPSVKEKDDDDEYLFPNAWPKSENLPFIRRLRAYVKGAKKVKGQLGNLAYVKRYAPFLSGVFKEKDTMAYYNLTDEEFDSKRGFFGESVDEDDQFKLRMASKWQSTALASAKLAWMANPGNFISMYLSYRKGGGFVFPGSNYIGPGNPMNRSVTSRMDEFARIHDIDYGELLKQGIDPKKVYCGFSEADERLMGSSDTTTPEGLACYGGMAVKKAIDRLGLV